MSIFYNYKFIRNDHPTRVNHIMDFMTLMEYPESDIVFDCVNETPSNVIKQAWIKKVDSVISKFIYFTDISTMTDDAFFASIKDFLQKIGF